MIHVFVDFETRAKLKPKDVGARKYAQDKHTLPLMLAYGTRAYREQWRIDWNNLHGVQPCPESWRKLVDNHDVVFHAHNAAFEIAIYDEICVARWGWPKIPIARWRCTLAKASAANQPRALGKLAKRLKLADKYQKDARGKELIKALSEPQKALKTYLVDVKGPDGKNLKVPGTRRNIKVANPRSEQYLEEQGVELFSGQDAKAKYYFDADPNLVAEFEAYNLQDIVAEMEADAKLPLMPATESRLWTLDREINTRGIPFDPDLCRGAMAVYDVAVSKYHAEINALTDGAVEKCSQRERIVNWLNERINFGESMTADIMDDFLLTQKGKVPDDVYRVVELRSLAGGTAVAKYKAALDFGQDDNRVRDQLLYYGASTGRWTGKGVQPHNMKRAAILDDSFIRALQSGDYHLVEALADLEGMQVIDVLKKCVRGLIKAPEGKTMIVSDFAGIEARVLHWLVGGEAKLEIFRSGQDVYIENAAEIYKVDRTDIATWSEADGKFKIKKEHAGKRDVGKVAELALGYQMGGSTFYKRMLVSGIEGASEEFAEEIKDAWREANPLVVDFWYRIEKACRFVVKHATANRDRKIVKAKLCGLTVSYDPRKYLTIQLPSGRKLYYYQPRIDWNDRGKIYYSDGSKMGTKENYHQIDTYGGKLCENIVQAIARDLLVNSLFKIDDAGLELIFHVHDEAVALVDESEAEAAFKIVHEAMSTVPHWAATLPLTAETQITRRYTK